MLPDRSILIRQKLVETAKIVKLKCDILVDFQTLCSIVSRQNFSLTFFSLQENERELDQSLSTKETNLLEKEVKKNSIIKVLLDVFLKIRDIFILLCFCYTYHHVQNIK